MTRFWIRNLTSRNDSRTGAWLVSRGDGALGGAPPGATGRLEPGAPGAPSGPGEPGRALSIRFRRDIAYTPSRPEGLATAVVIARRTRISSGWTSGCRRRPARSTDHSR